MDNKLHHDFSHYFEYRCSRPWNEITYQNTDYVILSDARVVFFLQNIKDSSFLFELKHITINQVTVKTYLKG